MKCFDLINTPLNGPVLIEASAGTGKTYSISGLFVRLIVEQGLGVEQILVVTYTTAATQELKSRIREKLIQTRRGLTQGSNDLFISGLADKIADRQIVLQRIDRAIADFDCAAIFTIHGFCQRLLFENAFETGAFFDTRLVTDPTVFYREVAEDFWRKCFYKASSEFIGFVTSQTADPGPVIFYDLLRHINIPGIEILPSLSTPREPVCDDFRNLRAHLARDWPTSRSAVIERLASPALNANKYGSFKPDRYQPDFSIRALKTQAFGLAMDQFCQSVIGGFPLFKEFEKFTTSYILNATKKGCEPPDHPFFYLCDRLYVVAANLQAEMTKYYTHLKSKFLKCSQLELATVKKEHNIFFFDDLLTSVNHTLMRDDHGAKNLIKTVQRRFKAALVDEFQDTDTLQYEIFSRFFGKPPSLFFMIGDPKQSIYSFRGADIFSYINAAAKTEHQYTLVENWRSDPALIKALNTLFESANLPFLYREIRFEKAKAGGIRTEKPVRGQPPLTLWFLPSKNEKPIKKTDAVRIITAAVGNEIARLIKNSKDRYKPEDIAVLVRTNRQAELIKECLSRRGMPSVLYGAGNVFDSFEARELQLVLKGIIENRKNESVRSALVTEMLGSRPVDIDTDETNPNVLDKRQNHFREYYEHWKNRGFMSMFRWLMSRESIRARLLAYFDGDRRLTNILHLSEILHQFDLTNMVSPTDLLQWLTDQRNPETPRLEEHQLRLETDKKAVRIVTIHKSKGLEYEIVFCPFGWESSLVRRGKEVICHQSGTTRQRVIDFGSPNYEEHLRKNQNENLAENLRLLYVALTRAKTHCYLVWGHIKTAETSALAYLFHHGSTDVEHDVVNSLKSHVSKFNSSDLLTDLERLVDRSEGSIVLTELPPYDETSVTTQRADLEPLFCRSFAGQIDTSWKISSYTSLVSQRQQSAERPDRDDENDNHSSVGAEKGEFPVSETSVSDTSKKSIHEFPKGARAGIFFHSLLEHIDFTIADDVYLDEMIQAHLRTHGFDLQWQDVVRKTVQSCLSVTLRNREPELLLSKIGPLNRINELAFTYPTKAFSRDQLLEAFLQNRGSGIPKDFPVKLERLDFSLSGGFLKGYIDLIFKHNKRFFLLDWKSNNLGRQVADYHQNKLEKIMSSSYYILQYCLYSLALNRYLKMRHPNYTYYNNFGGVFYVFIRGVDPAKGPDYGVYFDRPDGNLIEALDQIIIAP